MERPRNFAEITFAAVGSLFDFLIIVAKEENRMRYSHQKLIGELKYNVVNDKLYHARYVGFINIDDFTYYS